MTAQPTPRERARPDFPAVVHTYTDVLRVLRDQGDRTAAELAQATGRVLSNVKRDLHKLVAADVVALSTDFASLTDKGRQWLAGMDVAQGGEHRGPHILVPLDQLEFNPENPRGTIRDVEGLADSIVADADQGGPGVIQPLSVSPPDANGVRIVWAGNRRLAAVRLLAEQNRLPAALVDGLPCVEREADAVQALLLAIVENGQREDLSPLEDAHALAALADASGWSAREVAKQTGRSPADSEAGVRDVQVKIKVAREATPEAIAEYERTGSWDALRDSVTKPRPRPAPEQELREALAACGPAVLAGPEAGDQLDIEDVAPRDRANGPDWVNGTPYTRRFDRHHPTHTAGDFAPDLPWTPDGFAPLADALEPDALATYRINEDAGHGFPAAQIQVAALRGGRGWIYAAGYSTAHLGHHESLRGLVARRKEAFPDRETAIAAGVDLIRDSLGRNLKWKLPAKIDAWLRQMETPAQRPAAVETTAAAPAAPAAPATDDPLVVDGVRYPNLTRANEARARLEGKRISIAAPPKKVPDQGGGCYDPRKDSTYPHPAALPWGQREAFDFYAQARRLAETVDFLTERADQLLEQVVPVLANLNDEAREAVGFEAEALRQGVQTARALLEREEVLETDEGEAPDNPALKAAEGPDGKLTPAVPIRQSVTADFVTCLEDGRRFKGGLRRYLRTRYNLSPAQYRARWGLPADYPMNAPNFDKARHDLRQRMGLV